MRQLKGLGLAAFVTAAMGLMAFAGAGTASADELCTEPAVNNMCPAGKRIEKLELSLVGSARTEDTSHNVLSTCTAGSWKVTNLTGNETVTVSVTGESPAADTTWGISGTPCTITMDTLKGGTVHFTEAAGGGTTITATGEETTKKFPIIGTCVYTFGTGVDLGAIAQGGNTLEVNKTEMLLSGLCPSSTVWNATYRVTNHTAVYYINN